MHFRCSCGFYAVMPVVRESVCCNELEQVTSKMNEQEQPAIDCITQHEGFYSVLTDMYWIQHTCTFGNSMGIQDKTPPLTSKK